MNLTPTSDSRIYESSWFVHPIQPLLEFKVFYAKVDDFLAYVVSRRGASTDAIKLDAGVQKVVLTDATGLEDDSRDCFNALVKYLDTPAHA